MIRVLYRGGQRSTLINPLVTKYFMFLTGMCRLPFVPGAACREETMTAMRRERARRCWSTRTTAAPNQRIGGSMHGVAFVSKFIIGRHHRKVWGFTKVVDI